MQFERFRLWVDGVGSAFHVASFDGVERLSRPWRFELDALLVEPPSARAMSRVGRRAAFAFDDGRGHTRAFEGVVSAWRVEGVRARGDLHRVRVRLAARLWLLGLRRDTRVFQHLDVLQVLEQVLARYGLAVESRLRHRVPALEYCVQYAETDLAFAHRILAEHGLCYWLRPPDDLADRVDGLPPRGDATDHGALVVCDDPHHYPRPVAHGSKAEAELRFVGEAGSAAHDDGDVTAFGLEASARPVALVERGFDFLQPLVPHGARSAAGPDTAPSLPEAHRALDLEHYDHHDEYGRPVIGRQTARAGLEALRADAEVGLGQALVATLTPGQRFVLRDHPADELNGEYVAVRVEHRGRTPELSAEEEAAAPVYTCRFRCAPSAVMVRPRRRPRRAQQVLETALVVGLEREEIYTDEHGRVKVQFHWDRHGERNAHSSCWVRVAQAWAGAGRGAQFIPRVGDEVLVGFLEGDADRPVILGSLYNGSAPTPFHLPHDKARSGLRTRSTPDADGYSELSFDDTVGRERVHLRAQRDLDVAVRGAHAREVSGDEHVQVRGSQRVTVDTDRAVHVRGDARAQVDGAHALAVTGDLTERVEGTRARRVTGDATDECHGSQTVKVWGARDTKVTVDRLRADQSMRKVSQVDVHKVDGALLTNASLFTLHARGSGSVSADGPLVIRSNTSILLRVGGSTLHVTASGVSVNGQRVTLRAPGAAVEVDGSTATIDAGTAKVVSDTSTVQGSGAVVTVGSSAEIRAPQVKLVSGSASDGDDSGSSTPTEIELVDQDGNALGGEYYEVHHGDGAVTTGVLDEEGKATVQLDEDAEVVFPTMAVAEPD